MLTYLFIFKIFVSVILLMSLVRGFHLCGRELVRVTLCLLVFSCTQTRCEWSVCWITDCVPQSRHLNLLHRLEQYKYELCQA
jgi:hypothetical protein